MIPTVQFQNLSKVRIIPIFIICGVFFTTFLFGSTVELLFDNYFYLAFGYTISL